MPDREDDGFYHGYDDRNDYSQGNDQTSLDEEARRKAEYYVKVNQIMGEYNATNRRYDHKNSIWTALSAPPHESRLTRTGRRKNRYDEAELSTRLSEEQKQALYEHADRIQYNRSQGRGFSNGGNSQYDFVGSESRSVNTPRQAEPMYYGQPFTPENTFMPQNTWDSRDEGEKNGNRFDPSLPYAAPSQNYGYGQSGQENRYRPGIQKSNSYIPAPAQTFGNDRQGTDPYDYENYGRNRTVSRKRVATKQDGKSRYIRLICLGILILMVGVIVVSMGIRIMSQDQAFFNKAMTTPGQVIRKRNISTKSSVDRNYRLDYSFTLSDGQTYEGSDVVKASKLSSIGLSRSSGANSIVTVYYDPDNPSSSRLIGEDVTITYVVGLFSTMASIYLIFKGCLDRYRFANAQYLVFEENGRKKFELIK